MTRICRCGLQWGFEPLQIKDRQANTHFCDCGEMLLTSYGNIAYAKTLLNAVASTAVEEVNQPVA